MMDMGREIAVVYIKKAFEPVACMRVGWVVVTVVVSSFGRNAKLCIL